MALVTREQAKAQCRVTNSLEDDLFDRWILTADIWIKNYLNRDNIPVNEATQDAALMIVHDLWLHRGATVEKDFMENPAVDRLLFPYRDNMGI